MTKDPVFVASGEDRFNSPRKVLGTMELLIKVSGRDTNGQLMIVEHRHDNPGGPPRHLHEAQDEWFYVVGGAFVVEIEGTVNRLLAGDSILAPRGVPHTWASEGEEGSHIVIAFQPAGQMEEFFEASTQFEGPPSKVEIIKLFADHGMTFLGPPLDVPSR